MGLSPFDFMEQKLFLFDVDGTLMSSPSFLEEYQKYLGEQYSKYFSRSIKIDFSGLHGGTERKNLRILLKRQNLEPSEKQMDEIFRMTGNNYIATPNNSVLLSNVFETVNILSKSCLLGIVTGNQETVARKRLKIIGLNKYFSFGAFGNESEDRSELVRQVLERSKTFGWGGNLNDAYVVGDTPADVESGKSTRTKTVAVTTGSYSKEILAKSNPNYLISNLSELLILR